MIKEETYREKFILLEPFMPRMISDVKKDLKNYHLKRDAEFLREHFAGKNINKVPHEEFVAVYERAVKDPAGEELCEFIANRWILKNSEIYYFFEKKMSAVYQDFTELKELSPEFSTELVKESTEQFGPVKTYIFAIINSVVFPSSVYKTLSEVALEANKKGESAETPTETATLENIHKQYEQKMSRLTDKYEKKLSGMERKYERDVDALKKQIANLQRKLNEHAAR